MRRALALVFSNPADIELELAAAIEREESEVTSGLSAFPVQMNKAVFSLYVAVSGNVVEFALVVSYVL